MERHTTSNDNRNLTIEFFMFIVRKLLVIFDTYNRDI